MQRVIWVFGFLILYQLSFGQGQSAIPLNNLKTQVNELPYEEFEKQLQLSFSSHDLSNNPEDLYNTMSQIVESVESPVDNQIIPQTYRFFGNLFKKQGNYDIALTLFKKSLKISEAVNFSKLSALTLNDIGNIFYAEGSFEQAEEKYNEALDIAQGVSDKNALAVTYNNLALIHRARENFQKSRELHYAALEIREKLNDPYLTGHSYTYLGDLNKLQGNIKSAMEMYRKAVFSYGDALDSAESHSGKKKSEIKVQIAFTHLGMAKIYVELEQLDEANSIINQIDHTALEIISLYEKANLLIETGTIAHRIGKHEKAKQLAKEAFNIAKANGFKKEMVKTYNLLSGIYKAMGNFEQALAFKDIERNLEADIAKEKLESQMMHEEFNHLLSLEEKSYQIGNLSTEVSNLRSKLSREISLRNILVGLSVFLIIGAMLMVFLMRRSGNQAVSIERNKRHELSEALKAEKQQREKVEEQLNKQQNSTKDVASEKAKIVSIIAHDLRTPLNSIIGLIDLIEMEDENKPSDKKKYVELIRESSNRMLRMINDILNLRRIENHKLNPEIKVVNVDDITQNVVDTYKPWMDLKDIKCEVNKINAQVETDSYLFEQIIRNLVSNAIKYSPLNSSIAINVAEENGQVEIAIEDHGPGISEEEQQNLFKKFARLSSKPTAGEDSLGIGLYTAKTLAEQLSGKVSFRTSLGKGSVFTLSMPKA